MDCKNGAAAHSLYCCHVSERLPIKVNKKIGEFEDLKKNFFPQVDEDNCSVLHSSWGQSIDCSTQSSNGLTVHRSEYLYSAPSLGISELLMAVSA